VTAGHYYGQQCLLPTPTIAGQQLHRSVSMGSMLNTTRYLQATATVLQTAT